MMECTVDEKKKILTVVIDLEEPHKSKSGATMVIASTGGNQRTGAKYKGETVIVGLNAYYKEGSK